MDALILAAGEGSRLAPFTKDSNKVLIEIDGEPIIGRSVRCLRDARVGKIYVVLGHCGNKVEGYLKNRFSDQEFVFVYNNDYASSNNIVSYALGLKAFLDSGNLGDGIVTLEGDLIFKPSLIKNLMQASDGILCALSRYEPSIKGTVATLGKDNIVNGFILGRDQTSTTGFYNDKYKTINIYLYRSVENIRKVYEFITLYIKGVSNQCYYEETFEKLVRKGIVIFNGLVLDSDLWYEIDDWNDYYKACYIFSSDRYELLSNSYGGYWNYRVKDFAFPYNALFPCSQLLCDLSKDLSVCLSSYSSVFSLVSEKLGHLEDIADTRDIYPLNGLCEIYPILKMFINDAPVLIPKPTFGEYESLSIKAIFYSDNGELDLLDIEEKIKKVNFVIFVNPNNPTGTLLQTAIIRKFATKYPDKMFFVDESFLDFSEEGSLVFDCPPNVTVLKSLGKSYGVPGLRIGYVFTRDDRFVKFLTGRLPIWNTNSIAEHFLELCLAYKKEYYASLIENNKNRVEFRDNLIKAAIFDEVFSSGANFLLCKTSKVKYFGLPKMMLERYNIFIKDVTNKFSDGNKYFRITVKRAEDNKCFWNCLTELYADE